MSFIFGTAGSAAVSQNVQTIGKPFDVSAEGSLVVKGPMLQSNTHPAFLGQRPVTLRFVGDGARFGKLSGPHSDTLHLAQPGTTGSRGSVWGNFVVTMFGKAENAAERTDGPTPKLTTAYTAHTAKIEVLDADGNVLSSENLSTIATEGARQGRAHDTTLNAQTGITVGQRVHTTRAEDCWDNTRACPSASWNAVSSAGALVLDCLTGGYTKARENFPFELRSPIARKEVVDAQPKAVKAD